jgi:hypothetical protein
VRPYRFVLCPKQRHRSCTTGSTATGSTATTALSKGRELSAKNNANDTIGSSSERTAQYFKSFFVPKHDSRLFPGATMNSLNSSATSWSEYVN